MEYGNGRVSDQRGSTLLLVAMFMVGLFGFAALTIDVARVYKEKRHEQFGADAGAFAAVYLLTNSPANGAMTAAIQEATDVSGANGVTSSELTSGGGVQVGVWANGQFTANITTNGYYNAVLVPAKRNVGMTFAKVVGLGSMNPTVQSIADLETAGQVANALPFGVSLAEATNHSFGGTMTLNDTTIGSGKQGKVYITAYQDTGAWAADMNTNGCNCTVSVGTVNTKSGNGQVDQSFNALSTGSIFIMPVVDQFSFSGNSGVANIVGFVIVQLVGSSGNGNNWTATVKFLAQVNGSGGGSCPPPCAQTRAMVQ
jgi:Flp pilus assembly protein TadG